MFASHKLDLGPQDARTVCDIPYTMFTRSKHVRQFQVALDPPRPGATRPPRTISVKITLAATLNAAYVNVIISTPFSLSDLLTP